MARIGLDARFDLAQSGDCTCAACVAHVARTYGERARKMGHQVFDDPGYSGAAGASSSEAWQEVWDTFSESDLKSPTCAADDDE